MAEVARDAHSHVRTGPAPRHPQLCDERHPAGL